MSSKNIINIPIQTPSPSKRLGMRIKICGMKYPDNISEIALLQPDYLGFIFYEKSTRFFDGTIPKLSDNIKKVGVFVNAPLEDIIDKIEKYSLDLIQLHGEETPEFCEKLKKYLIKTDENSEIPAYAGIIKVFSIKEHFNFNQLAPFESVCDYFLFDTKGKLPGGNGYTFNWEVLQNYPSTKPYFLSGGIGLEEIENINSFLKRPESQYCLAIDVNSKFEVEAGFKDSEQLAVFKNKLN